MDRFSSSRGGGSQAVYANAAHDPRLPRGARARAQRDEIITTIFSHPCDGAGPATAGYKVITLYPDADGLPDARGARGGAVRAHRRR